jgi:hypothetical protein
MRNLKRVKFYSSCQLLHVTAASIYAHACLLQDCNLPADAVQQFECSALLFAFLDQPSLHATCLLRTSECEGVQHVAVAMARVLQAPATHAARAIVPRLSAILHD